MPEFMLYGSSEESPRASGGPTLVGEPTRKNVYIHSGQLHVSDEPCAITTILGSCVAVCIWDVVHGFGGATHYLLPYRASVDHSSLRFGNFAVEELIGQLLNMGGSRRNLQSKLFGGACIFAGIKRIDEQLGTKNVEVALRMLQQNEIPVITHDVGGPRGRKLIFNTDSGDAWVKLL